VCASAAAAAQAARNWQAMATRFSNLSGGMSRWQRAGLPVKRARASRPQFQRMKRLPKCPTCGVRAIHPTGLKSSTSAAVPVVATAVVTVTSSGEAFESGLLPPRPSGSLRSPPPPGMLVALWARAIFVTIALATGVAMDGTYYAGRDIALTLRRDRSLRTCWCALAVQA